jgi:hypothetical protein
MHVLGFRERGEKRRRRRRRRRRRQMRRRRRRRGRKDFLSVCMYIHCNVSVCVMRRDSHRLYLQKVTVSRWDQAWGMGGRDGRDGHHVKTA